MMGAGCDVGITAPEGYTIETALNDFEKVRKALEQAHIPMVSAELTMIPAQTIEISADQAEKLQALVDALEDNDDGGPMIDGPSCRIAKFFRVGAVELHRKRAVFRTGGGEFH